MKTRTRVAATAAALGLALGGLAAIPTQASALSFFYMTLESTSGVPSGWCMADPWGERNQDQELYKCGLTNGEEGYAVQQSAFGDSDWYQIVVENTGQCLANPGGADGDVVVEENCDGGADQALCYDNYSTDAFSWPVAWRFDDGQAIADDNDKGANGNPIVTWTVNYSNSEAWEGPQINLRFACTSGD